MMGRKSSFQFTPLLYRCLRSSILTLTGMTPFLLSIPVISHAQVTTAITESGLNTKVTPPPLGGTVYEITGGTRPGNGPNLFHGFGEFSVGTADIARFQTTTLIPEPTISNILGRVTGVNGNPPNASNIFGTIDSITFYPNANMFLMNPAGIVFGPTATLNVGGSINFTTASYIRLFDEVNSANFYADPVRDGLASSVLSTSPLVNFGFLTPAAFGFLTPPDTNATITVQGSMLSVPVGQSITLVGRDINIVADPETGIPAILTAPSGQINLASVASSGEVLLPNLQTVPNVNGELFTTMGTISISGSSFLDVSGSLVEGDGHGGAVRIRGGQFVMDNSFILATTFGEMNGETPGVSVAVDGAVQLRNLSGIQVNTDIGSGRSGDVEIQAGSVQLADGSFIFTASGGSAPTGNVTIDAETISIAGGLDETTVSNITTLGESGAEGGNVTLMASAVSVQDLGAILTSTNTGRAGTITVDADNLSVTGGGTITTQGISGSSGDITITAGETATISGQFGPGSLSRIRNNSEGSPANISITTGEFLLTDNAMIEGETSAEQGGRVVIDAQESLTISGGGVVQSASLSAVGTVASIELSAPSITINQGQIKTRTGTGAGAGAITVTATAGDLTVTNGSLIAGTTFSSGQAGLLDLTATDSVVLSGGSRIESISTGSGTAGTVNLTAQNLVSLAGTGTGVFTETNGTGNGGTIAVQANQVQVADGAVMSAESTGAGSAGNVIVQGASSAAQSILINGAGSGIFTTTKGTGAGGNINIFAQSFTLQNGGTLSAATSGTGNAGSIAITSTGNTVTLSGGSRISSNSTGTMANAGDAGSVTINAGNLFQSSGSTVATSAAQGQGGNITITASQEATLNNGTNITASSTGPGNAGDIFIKGVNPNGVNTFFMENSSVTTQATQASGGNISIIASNMVRMTNSQISASVFGGPTTVGGNITIDPTFVVLQNSQILAQAVQGQGGNILITALVPPIRDANSVIDASSQFGLSGTVTIQSPTSNLSAVWARLQQNYTEAAALLRARCAAQVSGQYSSFVQTGRDAIPLEPGGWLLSPMTALGAGEGPGVRGEGARSVVASSVLASEGGILSLRGFDQNLSWPGLRQMPRRFVSVLDSACGS